MNLADLINSGANISVTVTGKDLAEFAKAVALEIMHETKQTEKEKLIAREELLKIASASTLWRWEKEQYLTPVRIGAKVFYKQSDLEARNITIK